MGKISKLKKKLYFIGAAYFRHFSNRVLKRWHPRIIAITGSVGKTTMLNLLEYELGKKAHYSHNANSAFGIAFDLVNLRGIVGSKFRWFYLFFAVPIKSLFVKHTEEYYIVEIDGERPHETEFLAKWLKPEVTLWISLGRSHAAQFEHTVTDGEFENVDKAITHEFAMLPQYSKKMVYIDGDTEMMMKACSKVKKHHNIPAEVVPCYKSDLKSYEIYPDYADFVINKSKESKNKEVSFHFYRPEPKDLAIQLVMLIKLAYYLDIDLKTDFKGLKTAPGRCSYFDGKRGIKIIDSSYNAHLISMQSVLEMFGEMKADHKWAVIGDIIDQGTGEDKGHEKLAEIIKKIKPEQVVLVGHRTKKYTAPILEKAGIKVFSTLDTKEALSFIENNISGNETILFKGSQYLEWVIEKLLKNPTDSEKLARREKIAIKRRLKWGLDS